jgi:competence protein ComEC
VALPLAMSSAAQLAMVPILAYEFHQVSPAGFLANVPVVPAAGLLVVTGLTASGLGLLSGTAATWLNGFNHGLLYLTMRTTCFFSELPGGFISTPGFSWWPLVLACGLLALLAVGLQGKLQFRRERWIVYGLLLLTGVVVWQAARSLNATLRVTFLDVGSGDAILIQSPAGRTMLIDGGPYQAGPPEYDAGERVVVPVLMSLGVKRLDVVVATHCQSDHIGGLPAVLREVPVGHLLVSDTDEDTDAAERLRCVAQERQVKIVSARRGQKINLGRGVHAYVLWPTERPLTGTGEDSNNNSVVLKLVYGRVSFLFTGDLEAAAERELLKRTGHLASTVLKVAHHGSKGSTTPEFLREVRPAVAVISVGTQPERGVPPPDRTNVHGHPTPTVRQRLTDAGTHLYRTDLDGAVTVCTNGRTWRVKTYGER